MTSRRSQRSITSSRSSRNARTCSKASRASSSASHETGSQNGGGVTDRDEKYIELEWRRQTRQLFAAIDADDVIEVKRLVRSDEVDTNVTDEEDDVTHRTPLIAAVKRGNSDIARVLLKSKKHPADVNREDGHGKRPIWYVITRWQDDVIFC